MWFWFSLAAAVFSAIEVALNKHTLDKVSAPLLTWSMFSLSLPLVAVYFLLNRPTGFSTLFFIGTLSSSVLFVFSKTMTNQSIKQSFLSRVFPLSSLSVLFTYLFGLMILGESLGPATLLGLVVLIFGTYILNVEKAREGLLQPFKFLLKEKSSLIFIVSMILASLSGIFDKIGLQNAWPISPAPALLAEDIFMSIMLTGYMLREEKTWLKDLRKNFGLLTANSLIYMVSNIFTFLAFIGGPVALAGGIKRVQVLFVFLLGYFLLKDRPPKHIWLAGSIMVLGAILIKLSS